MLTKDFNHNILNRTTTPCLQTTAICRRLFKSVLQECRYLDTIGHYTTSSRMIWLCPQAQHPPLLHHKLNSNMLITVICIIRMIDRTSTTQLLHPHILSLSPPRPMHHSLFYLSQPRNQSKLFNAFLITKTIWRRWDMSEKWSLRTQQRNLSKPSATMVHPFHPTKPGRMPGQLCAKEWQRCDESWINKSCWLYSLIGCVRKHYSSSTGALQTWPCWSHHTLTFVQMRLEPPNLTAWQRSNSTVLLLMPCLTYTRPGHESVQAQLAWLVDSLWWAGLVKGDISRLESRILTTFGPEITSHLRWWKFHRIETGQLQTH